MPGIVITDFSISPSEISSGDNPVSVEYTCKNTGDASSSVKVKLFVLSTLPVSFDVASFDDELAPGDNKHTNERTIHAHADISSEKIIRLKIQVEDMDGNILHSRNTTVRYLA
jgi:hypothetical protein